MPENRWVKVKINWASGDTTETRIPVDDITDVIYIQGMAVAVSAGVDTITLTESISNA